MSRICAFHLFYFLQKDRVEFRKDLDERSRLLQTLSERMNQADMTIKAQQADIKSIQDGLAANGSGMSSSLGGVQEDLAALRAASEEGVEKQTRLSESLQSAQEVFVDHVARFQRSLDSTRIGGGAGAGGDTEGGAETEGKDTGGKTNSNDPVLCHDVGYGWPRLRDTLNIFITADLTADPDLAAQTAPLLEKAHRLLALQASGHGALTLGLHNDAGDQFHSCLSEFAGDVDKFAGQSGDAPAVSLLANARKAATESAVLIAGKRDNQQRVEDALRGTLGGREYTREYTQQYTQQYTTQQYTDKAISGLVDAAALEEGLRPKIDRVEAMELIGAVTVTVAPPAGDDEAMLGAIQTKADLEYVDTLNDGMSTRMDGVESATPVNAAAAAAAQAAAMDAARLGQSAMDAAKNAAREALERDAARGEHVIMPAEPREVVEQEPPDLEGLHKQILAELEESLSNFPNKDTMEQQMGFLRGQLDGKVGVSDLDAVQIILDQLVNAEAGPTQEEVELIKVRRYARARVCSGVCSSVCLCVFVCVCACVCVCDGLRANHVRCATQRIQVCVLACSCEGCLHAINDHGVPGGAQSVRSQPCFVAAISKMASRHRFTTTCSSDTLVAVVHDVRSLVICLNHGRTSCG